MQRRVPYRLQRGLKRNLLGRGLHTALPSSRVPEGRRSCRRPFSTLRIRVGSLRGGLWDGASGVPLARRLSLRAPTAERGQCATCPPLSGALSERPPRARSAPPRGTSQDLLPSHSPQTRGGPWCPEPIRSPLGLRRSQAHLLLAACGLHCLPPPCFLSLAFTAPSGPLLLPKPPPLFGAETTSPCLRGTDPQGICQPGASPTGPSAR